MLVDMNTYKIYNFHTFVTKTKISYRNDLKIKVLSIKDLTITYLLFVNNGSLT